MLALPAELTQVQATQCLANLTAAARTGTGPVVVNASGLQSFDSAAIAVLLATRREAQRLGKSFAVFELPQRLRTLATLYGVAELLPEATPPV